MNTSRAGLVAHDRWAATAGPWRRWMLDVPLLAPFAGIARESSTTRVNPLTRRLADTLLQPATAAPTLVVLDMSPILGARVAATLARASAAYPVLYLGRWPYAEAVLPCGRLLASLLTESRRLPATLQAPSVTVVLDGERDLPVPDRSPLDRRVDNRYEVSAEDLPDPPALAAAGIGQVLLVSASGVERAAFAADAERRYLAASLAVERRVAP